MGTYIEYLRKCNLLQTSEWIASKTKCLKHMGIPSDVTDDKDCSRYTKELRQITTMKTPYSTIKQYLTLQKSIGIEIPPQMLEIQRITNMLKHLFLDSGIYKQLIEAQKPMIDAMKPFINPKFHVKAALNQIDLIVLDEELLENLKGQPPEKVEELVIRYYTENDYTNLQKLFDSWKNYPYYQKRKEFFNAYINSIKKLTFTEAATSITPAIITELTAIKEYIIANIPKEKRDELADYFKQGAQSYIKSELGKMRANCPEQDIINHIERIKNKQSVKEKDLENLALNITATNTSTQIKELSIHLSDLNNDILTEFLYGGLGLNLFDSVVLGKSFQNSKKIKNNKSLNRHIIAHAVNNEPPTLLHMIQACLYLNFLFIAQKRLNKSTSNIN